MWAALSAPHRVLHVVLCDAQVRRRAKAGRQHFGASQLLLVLVLTPVPVGKTQTLST